MNEARRTCLRCGQAFDSPGPGWRFCRRCGAINNNVRLSESQLQLQRGAKRWNRLSVTNWDGHTILVGPFADSQGGRIGA